MKIPKILFFDIETSHAIACVWGCGKQYVNIDQIVKDRKILTIVYKWNTSDEVSSLTLNLSKHDITKFDDDADKTMLVKFMKEYSKADVVVAHNGRRFDIARLAGRVFQLGLPPIAPVLIDDTYTMTKQLDTISHKLDYLGKSLKIGRKIHTDLDLWLRIVWNKDRKALEEMVTYNIQDVLLLEKLYNKMRPYTKSKLNLSVINGTSTCPTCNGELESKGFRYSASGKFKRFICKKCGQYCKEKTTQFVGNMRHI